MKRNISDIILKIVVIFFCIYIFFTAWENREIVKTQWNNYLSGNIDYTSFINIISSNYLSDFADREKYINLNGLYARLTGHIANNEVVLLSNGMMTTDNVPKLDMSSKATRLNQFNKYLKEAEIPFLYVQAPDKMDKEKKLLPIGITNYGKENADEFLDLLKDTDINTLDLRPYTNATPELVDAYFYNTDHHWNPLGAFVGFQKITEYIQLLFPKTNVDTSILNLNQWEIHTKDNWFLGSHGKRVGIYFGGIDDLLWLTPNFDTKTSCAIPYSNLFYKGNFVDANIRTEFYESNKPDYWGKSSYYLYIGGDRALVQHRNLNAASNLKILLIKDSFSIPLQAFLSTEFQELDVIDPRFYTVGTLADYITCSQPDLVIMMLSPQCFFMEDEYYFTYGIENEAPKEANYNILIDNKTIRIDETKLDTDYYTVMESLQPNTTYQIIFKNVHFLQGESDCITVALNDVMENANGQLIIFDVDYYNQTNEYQWTFITPETSDNLQLVIYSKLCDNSNPNYNMNRIFEISNFSLKTL